MTSATAQETAAMYSITFHGSAGSSRYLPRFRKNHATLGAARDEIARVDRLRSGSARAAEPGVVHGPDGKLYAGS